MDLSVGNIHYLWLLLTLPPVVLGVYYFIKWRTIKQEEFADFIRRPFYFKKLSLTKRVVLYVLFIVLMMISLMDVLAGKQKIKVQNKGYDLVFAIDVSNSMNAEDVMPSRIEKAKKVIEEVLKNTSGNRVGLTIFAGDAYTLLPLTYDYHSVEQYLNNLSSSMIDIQGTDLGKAIKEASGLFNPNQKSGKIIVLLSDGEDHEGNEDSGIEYANDHHIQVITVGIGTKKGSTVPYFSGQQQIGTFTDENGETVISKLQEKALKEVASETGGMYFSSTHTQEVVDFLDSAIKKVNQQGNTEIETFSSKHYFQWFLAVALLVFFIISLTNMKNKFNI